MGPLHHQKADGKFACQLGLSRSVSAHAEGTRGLNLDRGSMSEMFSRRELESLEQSLTLRLGADFGRLRRSRRSPGLPLQTLILTWSMSEARFL